MFFGSDIFEICSYFVNTTYEDEVVVTYTINKVDESSPSRFRWLTYNKHSDYVSCTCRRFEFKGITCRHMLAFFYIKQVFQLPSQYTRNDGQEMQKYE